MSFAPKVEESLFRPREDVAEPVTRIKRKREYLAHTHRFPGFGK